jgi:drug/metabolite transporter (DMT)-like permease
VSPLASAGLALLSSLLWGTSDFLGGLVSRRRRPVAVVAGSQAFGLLLVAAVAVATRAWTAPVAWLPWGVAAAATGTSGLVAFYAALARARMGVVSPIAAMGAGVPVLLGVAGGERPTWLQAAGVVVALAGAVGASGPEVAQRPAAGPGAGLAAPGPSAAVPLVLAALAGLGFGLGLYAIERGSQASPVMTLVVMRTTTVVVLGTAAALWRTTGGLRRGDAVPLLVVGALDAGANLTVGIAATAGLLSVTAVLGSLYPVVTVLLARTLLQERLRGVQAAGVAATLLGVALIASG